MAIAKNNIETHKPRGKTRMTDMSLSPRSRYLVGTREKLLYDVGTIGGRESIRPNSAAPTLSVRSYFLNVKLFSEVSSTVISGFLYTHFIVQLEDSYRPQTPDNDNLKGTVFFKVSKLLTAQERGEPECVLGIWKFIFRR